MTKKKHRDLSNHLVLFLTLAVFSLSACGTLEVGVERPPAMRETANATVTALAAEKADLATQVATLESTSDTPSLLVATPTLMPFPTPIPASTELRVAFVNVTEYGNNVWLWTEGEKEAAPLTKDGGVSDVRISDDGEIVAFTRGDGLWMVGSDGTEERELVSAEDFSAMEPREPSESGVVLNRFDWIPGTHLLAFNTRLQMEVGLVLNDDLHLVNADTQGQIALLPPGEGGEFTYSPDGRQLAIVTRGSISLAAADGSNRREVFTYTPVATHSEAPYYARPVWAADSSALRVAIPPVDPYAQPSPSTSVWHIPADGTPASLIGNIATGQTRESIFSPNLRFVAHLHLDQSDPTSYPIASLLITSLDDGETALYYPEMDTGTQVTLDSGEKITEYPAASLFYGWAPDSQHFAFLANVDPALPPQALIGQLGVDAAPIYSDAEVVIDLRWVDADRYLFLAKGPKGWDILLGHLQFGGLITSVAAVVDDPPAYDFAAPPYGAVVPESGITESTPIPFGLIYQTAEGLWHVNSDGEVVQIFEHPRANRPAVSADGTQILYDEADDLWLADITTGERRNLTGTPERFECCGQWWPGQPDLILFSSSNPEDEGPNYGYPTVARLDGSEYRELDDGQVSFTLPAPSPDGQTVAYDRAGQAWLYEMDTGVAPFDLAAYGLSSDPQLRVLSPAWSPDGQQLAWIVGDCRQGECQYSVGVFDLETQAVQLLHPYTPVGTGGQPPAPAWSPDGRWLALGTWASDPRDAGLWVARANGQEEFHVDASLGRADPHPVWSPDGRWLAFSSTPQGMGSGIWLAKVGTWDLYPLDLPLDARIADWTSPNI
jgi:Tol biopolymer transport system component